MNPSLASREPYDEDQVDQQAIRDELARVLESPIFAQSDRLTRFLRFTVETTLAGEGATLKEYLVGTEVYDRKPPYHPSVDSIVRSEARRLRSKLRQYYESTGKDDPVFIYYRVGSYVPAFRHHRAKNRAHVPTYHALNEILAEALVTQRLDLSPADRKFEVQIIFEGTVRIVRSEPKSSALAPFATVKNNFESNPAPKVVSVSAANRLRQGSSRDVPQPPHPFNRTRKTRRIVGETSSSS